MAHADPELNPHPASAKAALRRAIQSLRDGLDPAERVRRSEVVLERVQGLPAFRQAHVVLGYASFGSELDTHPFLRAVLTGRGRLVLPRIDRAARRLALHEVKDLESDLRAGTWGILEPVAARCPAAAAAQVDFVLMPGLVFDPDGGQIGRAHV